MSNAKQKHSVIVWIQAESVDELDAFDDRIDAVIAEMDTVEFVPLDPEDSQARRVLAAWLYADRAPVRDELPEDETVSPSGRSSLDGI